MRNGGNPLGIKGVEMLIFHSRHSGGGPSLAGVTMGAMATATNPARPRLRRPGRPAVVVADLASLSGPADGMLELPLRLFWSGPTAEPARFDLDADYDALAAYQAILGAARTPDDLLRYLNAGLLERLWPSLRLPAATRQAWEAAHPALCAVPAAA